MVVKFLEISEDFKIKMCTSPQAVFVTLEPDDETTEQVIQRQEKFLKLPENIKDKLIAPQTAEKIKSIGAHYGLELLQMAPIARAIRSYYFGELKLENFVEVIKKESKIGEEEAKEIYEYILNAIINKEVKIENTAKKEKMTIVQALEKYPVMKRKLLTSLPIEINRINVSPTIENWINDYFVTVGAGNRDVMKRSSYLYHSKNTKGLNMIDRQKLSLVLKSLDEGFLLDIDTNRGEIIFDLVQSVNKNNSVSEINNQRKASTDYGKPVLQRSGNEIMEKIEKSPVANSRFLDGFSGMEKKEVNKTEAGEISPAKAEERLERVSESNLSSSVNDVNKKSGRFDFLIGNKKRDDFDKKNESSEMVIRHVSGNNWDLGSAHFSEKDGANKKSTNGFNILNKDADKDGDVTAPIAKREENIMFTSPQQLPVEKEIDKTAGAGKAKNEEGNNFFGKIRPIE